MFHKEQIDRFYRYNYDQIVSFDMTSREDIPAHQLFNNVVVKGHTLHSDGYRLVPQKVRGHRSIALLARTPGEDSSEYRPVLHGRKAMKFALALGHLEPWSLEAERIHDRWTEEGGYEPDHSQPTPNIWDYGY
jgi:hypothetical protein